MFVWLCVEVLVVITLSPTFLISCPKHAKNGAYIYIIADQCTLKTTGKNRRLTFKYSCGKEKRNTHVLLAMLPAKP